MTTNSYKTIKLQVDFSHNIPSEVQVVIEENTTKDWGKGLETKLVYNRVVFVKDVN